MAAKIKAIASGSTDEAALIDAMRAYVYKSGPWNGDRTFSYDMDDPLGRHLPNKLIGTYLATRKGNCVSMPILILLLGEKLGLEMTLAHAPYHLFIKYRPKGSDHWINLETTSGANPARDAWIRQNGPMTDESIASGIYMQPLSRNGVIAAMATTVMEHAMAEARYDDAIAIADIILGLDDRNIAAILSKASAYGRKMDVEFHRPYPNPADVPLDLHDIYKTYQDENRSGFSRAEQLGWRPEEGIAQ